MKIIELEQGSTEWLSFREGKRTGTTIGKIFAKSRVTGEMYDTNKPLITFYQKVAERLAEGTGDDDGLESSRERGKDLEQEAITEAEQKLGLKLIRGNVWQADEWHIESPDAYTKDLKTAVEVKCLSSARHIQAIIEDRPPQEYMAEYLNYFLVNDKLKTLYVFLYADARRRRSSRGAYHRNSTKLNEDRKMTNAVTELARKWNADGQDHAHIIYNVSDEIAQEMIDKFDLDVTDAQGARLEMALHDIVEDSIDWDVLADDDENAADWEDARRSAIYK